MRARVPPGICTPSTVVDGHGSPQWRSRRGALHRAGGLPCVVDGEDKDDDLVFDLISSESVYELGWAVFVGCFWVGLDGRGRAAVGLLNGQVSLFLLSFILFSIIYFSILILFEFHFEFNFYLRYLECVYYSGIHLKYYGAILL
jgi:hypothetical protein